MDISQNSQTIAKNTILLYFRMLLMLLIGLYTSRVILKNLGVSDYGIYTAVAGAVTVFTFITNSIGTAISRFIAFELGRGEKDKLQRIFSTSIIIQALASILIILLVETLGMWLLDNRMDIPFDRMDCAHFVLHCSLGMLVINLMAVPYNATIIAHEKMGAYATISILEAFLKLAVAFALALSTYDKLKTYALLMLGVSLIVRTAYASFCRRHFKESRGRIIWDSGLVREMSGFAGWSFLGHSAYIFNTQGINVLSNVFFGVVVSAARGIAVQVEGIVKQFVNNILTAFNPQITKSWASGEKDYCYSLVIKASKFSGLVMLIFIIPFWIEAEALISLWLGQLPEHSATFVRLTLICLMGDMFFNPLLTLQQATGKIRTYYLITGFTSLSVVPLSWLAFRIGVLAEGSYLILAAIYIVTSVQRLCILHHQINFPVRLFLKGTVVPVFIIAISGIPLALLCNYLFTIEWLRVISVCIFSWIPMMIAIWFFGLDIGEKKFIFRKIGKWLPDRMYISFQYYTVFGKYPNLRHPVTFNEKIQYLKLNDRKAIYHTMVDKAKVKDFVAEKIGDQYIIPNIGVWNSPHDIPWDSLPDKYVLKCTHDSGSVIVVRDKNTVDKDVAIRFLESSQQVNFYLRSREWPYKGLKGKIICEECLEGTINDYKFFCFNGKPTYMFIATDREDKSRETCFDFYDMDFNHIDVTNGHPNAEVPPEKPLNWETMKILATELSQGIKQVRIDFYEVNGRIYFGEYTFSHWGGLVKFHPESFDILMGNCLQI